MLPKTISSQQQQQQPQPQPQWPAAQSDSSGTLQQQPSAQPQLSSLITGQLPSVFQDTDIADSVASADTISRQSADSTTVSPVIHNQGFSFSQARRRFTNPDLERVHRPLPRLSFGAAQASQATQSNFQHFSTSTLGIPDRDDVVRRPRSPATLNMLRTMDKPQSQPQQLAHPPGFDISSNASSDLQQQHFQHHHQQQQQQQQQQIQQQHQLEQFQQQQHASALSSPVTAQPPDLQSNAANLSAQFSQDQHMQQAHAQQDGTSTVQQPTTPQQARLHNQTQQSYSALPSPLQQQVNAQHLQMSQQQSMQSMQHEAQQQAQQASQQQQQQRQQEQSQGNTQPQMMPMQLTQPAHPAQLQAMSQPQTAAVTASAVNDAVQRPSMSTHQRSLSLGLHLHQLASQPMPQHSVPASADTLQSFDWPAAPTQNELLMSATPAQGGEPFNPGHQRAASHSIGPTPAIAMQAMHMNMQALPSASIDASPSQAQAQAQAQAQLQAQAQMQAQLQAQAQVQAQLQAQAQMQAQAQQAQAAAIRAASASTQQPTAQHSELMNQVAKLLDDVVLQANRARESYHKGDAMLSNCCLGDLQKDLQHLQHLSHRNFAQAAPASAPAAALPTQSFADASFATHPMQAHQQQQQQQQHQQVVQNGLAPALSLEQGLSRTETQQHNQQQQQQQDMQPLENLTLSQMQGSLQQQHQQQTAGPVEVIHSGQVSPIARKRPVESDNDLAEQRFKSQRSETATPIHPPPAPPSAPPTIAGSNAAMSHIQPPLPPQSAPPPRILTGLSGVPASNTLLAQATASLSNGVQSLNASPTTPQTPFEFPQAQQTLSTAMNGSAIPQSMPSSPAVRQHGHMRGGSLHDAMTMTPPPIQRQTGAAENAFANSGDRASAKISRSALQMSAISSNNTSGNQSAVDSGPSSPDESYSNGDSGDEGNLTGETKERHLTKHRRHRSSGFFSSGASFDFGAPEDGGNAGDNSMSNADKNGPSTVLSPELRSKLETIFHDFLTAVCSDLEITDDRGELLHQTLMPKKMARLDESPDFRPFKFRIQAFTNAFQAEVYRNGISEAECSIKKIKQFLWTQPYISRFNEDGKKAKSKGNHIWIVEAKKIPEGGWQFREFTRKIAGAPEKIAYVGLKWTWPLKVWDPQASSTSIKAVFSCNKVPSWIHWEENNKVLTGTPTAGSESGEVSVTAHYVHSGQLHQLQHSFYLQVASIAADDLQATDAKPSAGTGALAPELSTGINGAPPRQNVPVDATGMSAAPVMSNMMPHPMQQNLTPPGHAFINGQPPANFPNESINHQVVEPSKVSAVLNAISFPFTPPVHSDARPQYFQSLNNEAAMLTPQLSDVPGTGPDAGGGGSQLSSAMVSPMPPKMNHNPFQSAPALQLANAPSLQAPASSQALQQHLQSGVVLPPQSAPMLASQPEMQQHQHQHHTDKASSEEIQVHQVRSTIERKQQAQTANFMLSIPTRKAAIAAEAARPVSGQTTPMSSMPMEMAAQLPALNSLPPNESMASSMAPNALNTDATLSPALNVGFDALREAGMQLGLQGEQQNQSQQGQ
ncbi:hypothetical protein NDA13_000413 [Ustilago tritici]|nr:hypothetical protein NDA13_000413 [Ustilago tritici]